MKVKIVRDSDGLFYAVRFNCPACTWDDGVARPTVLSVSWLPPGETVESPSALAREHWGFNGNFLAPTFTPSVLTRWEEWVDEGKAKKQHICHSFIRDGKIEFLPDCTHHLAGQTVDLPDVERPGYQPLIDPSPRD